MTTSSTACKVSQRLRNGDQVYRIQRCIARRKLEIIMQGNLEDQRRLRSFRVAGREGGFQGVLPDFYGISKLELGIPDLLCGYATRKGEHCFRRIAGVDFGRPDLLSHKSMQGETCPRPVSVGVAKYRPADRYAPSYRIWSNHGTFSGEKQALIARRCYMM